MALQFAGAVQRPSLRRITHIRFGFLHEHVREECCHHDVGSFCMRQQWRWFRQRLRLQQDTAGTGRAYGHGAAHGEQDATTGLGIGGRGCALHHSPSLQSEGLGACCLTCVALHTISRLDRLPACSVCESESASTGKRPTRVGTCLKIGTFLLSQELSIHVYKQHASTLHECRKAFRGKGEHFPQGGMIPPATCTQECMKQAVLRARCGACSHRTAPRGRARH